MNFRIVSKTFKSFEFYKNKLEEICSKSELKIKFSNTISHSKLYPNGYLEFSIVDKNENLCVYGEILGNDILENELVIKKQYIYDVIEAEYFYESPNYKEIFNKIFFNALNIFDELAIHNLDEDRLFKIEEFTIE